MSRKILSLLMVLIAALICLVIRPEIELTESIPPVFYSSKFDVEWWKGATLIYRDKVPVDPITHDDKNLYILHGAGNDFINYSIFAAYKIDEINQEIVIIENLFHFKSRKNITYQVIKVPKWRYQKLVHDHKIRVRIKCAGAFRLIEYNLRDQSYSTIEQCPYAK